MMNPGLDPLSIYTNPNGSPLSFWKIDLHPNVAYPDPLHFSQSLEEI